jgi:hypothetical protein
MRRDLNAILGFLREMHKAELEDHYAKVSVHLREAA